MRLLSACVRPLADSGRLDAIRSAAEVPFDDERLIALAYRHRVAGFVQQGLAVANVPLSPSCTLQLEARAKAARFQSLRAAGEEVRVGQAMAVAGVDAIFVKGATLGMRAHGTLGLKMSWDVDVLVARQQLDKASAVLTGLGYRLSILDGVEDPVRIRRYLAAHKEAEWHHAERRTVVELHTELSDNRADIAGIGLASPRQTVEPMPGAPLQTLATSPLFAYLAYHGTSHLWSRLKWLADVAALLRGTDIALLHDEAVALGAGRTPGVAILLSHELLGLAVPDPLLARLRSDRGTRRLLHYCYAAIAAPQDADERVVRTLGELLPRGVWLVPGAAHRWGALRRALTLPYRTEHLAVPRWAVPAVILVTLPMRLLLRPLRLRRRSQAGGKTASKP